MMYRLFVNSIYGVDLDPEWDYSVEREKIETIHRARSGYEYKYKWGEFEKRKFQIKYVSSSTAAIVNSWWESNTHLRFMEEGNPSTIFSCYLINKKTPIGKNIKPYHDMFQGTIELGSY